MKVSNRKFWFACLSVAVLAGITIFAGYHQDLKPVFPEFVTGLIAITATFLTGNVASQWVDQKHGPQTLDQEKSK